MNRAEFAPDAPGAFVPTIEKQWAFVPGPLPPKIDLAEIAIEMGEAMQAIGELKGACRRLSNPYILVRPLQRREALTSSAMEGTFTTADQLLLAEAGLGAQQDDSTREVVNYLNALNEALGMLVTLPISHRVIKRAHQVLLSGLSASRGARKRTGEYKQDQNWIGGYTIDKARFVPPPPAETQQCMDALEAYLNRADRRNPSPLMDLALVHYQLETIHPFADGNGRVGRMLISLMAVHSRLLDMPVLYISPVLEKRKDEYIDLLFDVSSKNAWGPWLRFFFTTIVDSCVQTIATIDRLIDLQKEYRDMAASEGRSANAVKIVDMLFEKPVISVRNAMERTGVTYQAANKTLNKLVDLQVIKEFEGVYPKMFYAPRIRQVSEAT